MLAPEMTSDRGRPFRSVMRWMFNPFLLRSAGLGRGPEADGVDCAPQPGQLTAGTEPVREDAVESGPTPFQLHWAKQPSTVSQAGPHTARSCHQVATQVIAARHSRSPAPSAALADTRLP
jgi:hypothetical protein